MSAVILRLLTLAALMLMPFGMGAAGATPVRHAPATATAGHCDENGSQTGQTSSDRVLDCAMACSMMAAGEAPVVEPAPALRLPAGPSLSRRAVGLHPDTATPPPKPS